MRALLLGTGASAGVPMIGGPDGSGFWGAADPANPRNTRLRSSLILDDGPGGDPERRLLIDTGPDLRAQLLAHKIPAVGAILITHAHADHVAGIDDVRILNRTIGRPLDAWMTEATETELRTRFEYAFRPWDGGFFFRPALVARRVTPPEPLTIAGHPLTIFTQDHGWMPTLGLRRGDFAYSTDVVALDDTALSLLDNLDTWIVDCFQPDGPHTTHAWLARVLDWVDRLRPRRTILTHMGPDMDDALLRATLPPGIEPGYDGLAVTL